MSIEKTQSRDYDLASILRAIDEGAVALPDFQRDFDWPPGAVRSLLATVLNAWPMGSLLLIRGAKNFPFKLRPIEDAPAVSDTSPLIVLDGQQRLTGLYHALYAKGPFRYVLRLDLLDDIELSDQAGNSIDVLEESIDTISVDVFESRLNTPQKQLEAGLLPISVLRDAALFFEWRDEARNEGDRNAAARLAAIYRNVVSGLHSYMIPAVVVSPNVPPAGIARIFERVNRLGLPLGTFDLMVAKSFDANFNLRREWETAQENYPLLQNMLGDDGLAILNVIALVNQADVRQRAVLDMPGSAVRHGWQRAVASMDQALRFVRDNLGVWSLEWLPYRNMLTIFAALADDLIEDEFRALATQWFWATSFGRRYDVASNTRAVSDYKKLSLGQNPAGQSVRLVLEDMLECNKKQYGSLHRSFCCLIASGRPVDLQRDAILAPQDLPNDVELPHVEPVSIFSKYEEAEMDPPIHLRTLGMVLVSGRYSTTTLTAPMSTTSDRFRKSQLLPLTPLDEQPERFLRRRLRVLTRALSERGLRVATEPRE